MTDTVDAIAIARALGDTTRARIAALLQHRDLCVCELTKVLGQSQANISGHLKLLLSSGIVTSNRRSYWTHYAVAGNLPTDISHFLSAIMLQTTAQYPGDLLALERLPADACALKQQERRNAREGKQKPK
jgi:ArsR family transcriptional regulator